MDQDITQLQEELFNAKQEWRRVKYLQNGDKKKRACLLRVQAAEHALGLHGANKVAVDALAPERELTQMSSTNQLPSAGESNPGLSIQVKKEMIEGLFFGGGSKGGDGSKPENAMDVDAMFPTKKLETNNPDSIPGQCMDVDVVLPLGASSDTLSICRTPPLSPHDHISSNVQIQSAVSGISTAQDTALAQESSAVTSSTTGGQPMEVDTAPVDTARMLATSSEPEPSNMKPTSISHHCHSPSDEFQNEESNMDKVPDGALPHGVSTSLGSSFSHAQILESSANKLSDDVLAQGASASTSATQNVQSSQIMAENVNTELDDSRELGDSAGVGPPPSQPLESSTNKFPDDALMDIISDIAPPMQNSPRSFDHAQNDVANMNMLPDGPLVHEASAPVDLPLSQFRSSDSSLESSTNKLSDGPVAHGTSDATSSANQTTVGQLHPNWSAQDLSKVLAVNETLDYSAAPNVISPPTYRVINPTAMRQQPQKNSEALTQQVWTNEGQYEQTFAFETGVTLYDEGSAIPDNLLAMTNFGHSTDLYPHEQLWTIPETDEDMKNHDVETIAPYSGASQPRTPIYRSDTEAIQALSAELESIIAQTPNVLMYDHQYTFKINDINWDSPIPSYTRMAGDSDSEHRLRGESYAAKAAWMCACAYSGWIKRQKQMLEQMATKGVSDFSAFMAAWTRCEADTKVLSKREEEAKAQMDVAQREMDVCFKGKSRAALEFAIEELEAKILSDEVISPDDLHLLRTKLMAKKSALREVIEEYDVDSEDEEDKPKKNKGQSDASTIAYTRMTEERQIAMEAKARVAFHTFAQLAASPSPNPNRLKAAANAFRVSYRRTARMICAFLPEAATTSRESALLCLTTSTPNLFCRGHHQRHAASSHDSVTHFRGVAHAKNATSKGCGLTNPQSPEPNHMNCGCLIEDGLLEFYFWKTVTARSTHPLLSGVIHHMDGEVTPFIIRSFWVSQFRSTTGLTMDDIYNLKADEAIHQVAFTARMIQKHVYRLKHQLNIGVSLVFDTKRDRDAFFGITESDDSDVAE